MSDERQGRPSASSMGRVARCFGSWRLIRALRESGQLKHEQQVPPGEEPEHMALGNACHEYMRFPTEERFAALTSEGQWMVKRFSELFLQAVRQTKLGSGDIIREQRLWSTDKTFSGQMDIGVVDSEKEEAAVLDYKSGRVIVDPADQNYQLRTLAVLMAMQYGSKKVYAGVAQPRSDTPLTLCEYSGKDLEEAIAELSHIMEEIEKPDAPLTPGDWCNYCPAKAHCPALGAQAAIAVVQHHDIPRLTIPTTKEAVDAIDVPMLAKLMDMAKRGRAFFDAVEDRVAEMLKADPKSVPGWELGKDVSVSSITSAAKAYELLADHISPEEFAGACKVTLGKLEDIFQEKWKGKDTKARNKAALRELLAPATVLTVRSGSPKKVAHEETSTVVEAAAVADKADQKGELPELRSTAG